MIVDLVRTATRDGLRLEGAYQPPIPSSLRTLDLDALCFLHGTGSNFYGSTLFDLLVDRFRGLGIGVLRANTRGHDLMSVASRVSGGGKLQGAAYEMVEDCRYDVAAWMDWLHQHVGDRIGLLGHSLGAVKTIYAITQDPQLKPKCAIAVSPPHLSYSWFAVSPRKDTFLQTYQQAETLTSEGEGGQLMPVQFPLPMIITAAGYAEKYGPEERYNFHRFVQSVTCPTFVTLGSEEVASNVAFSQSPAVLNKLSEKQTLLSWTQIDGADHFYSDRREELASEVSVWLQSTLGKREGQDDWQI